MHCFLSFIAGALLALLPTICKPAPARNVALRRAHVVVNGSTKASISFHPRKTVRLKLRCGRAGRKSAVRRFRIRYAPCGFLRVADGWRVFYVPTRDALAPPGGLPAALVIRVFANYELKIEATRSQITAQLTRYKRTSTAITSSQRRVGGRGTHQVCSADSLAKK